MRNIRDVIAKTGAILEGEFFFALKKRGRVSTKYINLDPVFTYPALVKNLTSGLISPWEKTVQALASPAVGAIPLLYGGVAGSLSVRVVWADKQSDGTFAFERMGFAKAVAGKRVVVIEDVASTGDSTKAVCDLVKAAGGEVLAVSFVWNRGGVTAEALGVPCVNSLIEERVETWDAGEHPKWGIWPLVSDIGHPEYFAEYPGPRIALQA